MVKKNKPPYLRPWPGSTFALKTKWETWGIGKHFWVHLERRTPGRFGRLEAMHAIVPAKGRKEEAAKLFLSSRYRVNIISRAQKVMRQAGVLESQMNGFMDAILKEFPCPTREELFLEQLDNPFIAAALGKRRQEISFFKTGVCRLTPADLRLIKSCIDDLSVRMKAEPDGNKRFIDLLMGSPWR